MAFDWSKAREGVVGPGPGQAGVCSMGQATSFSPEMESWRKR